jgi:formylglycine-generating enzyme required for sulfatase activity
MGGGAFEMGGPDEFEGPIHTVTLETFWIRRSETTVAEYQRCVDAGRCIAEPEPAQGHSALPSKCNFGKQGVDDHPANCITWPMAKRYCRWLGGRLPSEAEWEYAARSRGQDHEYPWGNTPEPDCSFVAFKDGQGCGEDGTVPVCSHPDGDTEQGLCDMAGNAYEWTLDSFQDDYSKALLNGHAYRDPDAKYKALRGGGVGSDEDVRTRNRVFHEPDFFYSGMGFRCVTGGR